MQIHVNTDSHKVGRDKLADDVEAVREWDRAQEYLDQVAQQLRAKSLIVETPSCRRNGLR